MATPFGGRHFSMGNSVLYSILSYFEVPISYAKVVRTNTFKRGQRLITGPKPGDCGCKWLASCNGAQNIPIKCIWRCLGTTEGIQPVKNPTKKWDQFAWKTSHVHHKAHNQNSWVRICRECDSASPVTIKVQIGQPLSELQFFNFDQITENGSPKILVKKAKNHKNGPNDCKLTKMGS